MTQAMNETYQKIRSAFRTLNIAEPSDHRNIEKMRKKLAPDLPADENILFAGKGFNLLVTDRHVYAPARSVPISLEEVFIVTFSRFDFLNFFLERGVPKTELLINGRPVSRAAMGIMPRQFLIRTIEALGSQRRKELGEHEIDNSRRTDPVFIAATGICARRDDHQIQAALHSAGVDLTTSTQMIAVMREVHERKDRTAGIMMLVAGLLLVGVPFVVAYAMKKSGAGLIVVLSGVGATGAFIALYGLYKAVTGHNGITEIGLVNAWRDVQKMLRDQAVNGSGRQREHWK